MWRALCVFLLLVATSFGGPTGAVDDSFNDRTIRGGRIAGGTEASRNQFPYQVGFFVYTSIDQSVCGGSIFSANFVLSASHCFLSFEYADLLAGLHNIIDDDAAYELTILPSDVILHPQYNRQNNVNDIALVRTSKRPIVFSAALQPLPMIPRSFANTDLTNIVARIAGWGRVNDVVSDISPKLLFINGPIVSNAECTRIYGNVITTGHICMSGANARSTCQGDSGGPLTITNGNRQVQVGVVSFGSGSGCTKGYPTVFARITAFHNWIQTTTGVSIA